MPRPNYVRLSVKVMKVEVLALLRRRCVIFVVWCIIFSVIFVSIVRLMLYWCYLNRIKIRLQTRRFSSKILRYMVCCGVSDISEYVLCCRMVGKLLTRTKVYRPMNVMVL